VVEVPLPVKWGLRLLALTYVFLLVAWPVGLVVQHTFEDGLATLQAALVDPDVQNALKLTVEVAFWAVVINLVFGVGISLPLVIREVVPVLSEIGDDQEQAARSLGANARQTFLRITLPSIKWAVVYGVVLSLARSLGEFGAVKIVSGNFTGQTQTATLMVEQKYQNFEQGTAYATSFLLAFVSVACLIVVSVLRPKESK